MAHMNQTTNISFTQVTDPSAAKIKMYTPKSERITSHLPLSDFPSLGVRLSRSEEDEIANRRLFFQKGNSKDEFTVKHIATCTKACKCVTDTGVYGSYGQCSREVCTFAHSKKDIKPLECQNKNNCWNKHKQCYFIHPNESLEQWFSRLKINLPDTDKFSRNPQSPAISKVLPCSSPFNPDHTLICTKPCNRVSDGMKNNGVFGVCLVPNCTYAHGLDELKPPSCRHGVSCRFQKDTCRFIHIETESVNSWRKRTSFILPNLPLISAKKLPISTDNLSQEKLNNVKPFDHEHSSLHSHNEECDLDDEPIVPKSKLINSTESECKTDSEYESECGCESECECECESLVSKKESKPHLEEEKHDDSRIFRVEVPSQELAEVAIRAAFDRGVYNIEVVVVK